MATYKTFSEMPIWNEAVNFAAEIYRFCEMEKMKRDFRMRDQLRAAATSISSNIAEGFEYHSAKEFIRFLFYAKGSSCEVYTQLTILVRAGIISDDDFKKMGEHALLLSKKIGGLIQYVQSANSPIRQSVN